MRDTLPVREAIMRPTVSRILGMSRVVVHLARGATIMAFVFPLVGKDKRRRITKRWSDGVLAIFGLRLEVDGQPHLLGNDHPVLIVGNHISWVDIYAYLSVADFRFIAKSEVRSWPLIGWFARSVGTIFVERDRPRDAVRVGRELREALKAGHAVCLFPEGTTTDGSVVLPFSSALISAAVDTSAPVQPVAIEYRKIDGSPCSRAAFTGDATLLGSLWRLAGGETSIVRLSFLEPISTAGASRQHLARQAEDAVREQLGHAPRMSPAGTFANKADHLPIALADNGPQL